jgi:anti-sigma factor RsiW
MPFYLDQELHGSERAAIEKHLKNCANCRELFETEGAFLKAIEESRPLYVVPSELRTKVNKILSETLSTHKAPPTLAHRLQHSFSRFGFDVFRPVTPHLAATTATIVVLVILVGIWKFSEHTNGRQPVPSDFASMAVAVHQRHLHGRLPLEIMSDQPEEISAWFAGKVPFRLELPNYQEASGKPKRYDIQGARLVGYKNDYAACVIYRMGQQRISLLVTSLRVAQPSGGEEIFANRIAFHHDSIDGFKVITWSHRGLTYALVSDLDSPGQQSCMVCHEGSKNPVGDPKPNT